MHSRRAVVSLGLAVALSPCLFLASAAQGGPPPPPTNILYGFVTANRTLTYGYPGPVYYVPGDVVVNPGAVLTIEAGVTLLFAAAKDTLEGGDFPTAGELTIQGTVSAVGTPGSPIRFEATAAGAGQWGQIKIRPGGTLTLKEAIASGAKTLINSDGAVDISSVSGSSLQNGAVLNGTGRLYGSTFTGTGTGVGLTLRAPGVTAVPDTTDPQPCDVSGFDRGIQVESGTASYIVSHDNNYGCYLLVDGSVLSYLTLARNAQDGLRAGTASFRLYSSIVTNNPGCGVCVSFSGGHVNYTDSWSNGTNYGGIQNWFGPLTASFSPLYVNAGGSNFRLSAGSPFKTYGPWGAEIGAYGPGPGSPTPATPMTWGRVKATYR